MTSANHSIDNLNEKVDKQRKAFRTQSLDMSFNEIFDMYSNKELIITPVFQRLFRWSQTQQSRFIESLVLEMPIPPIFVIEMEDSKYELIDGLQRISTYLHLRGKLEALHFEIPIGPGQFLSLCDCDIVKELNGLTWNDLPTAIQIRLKRYFVRMEVIRSESDRNIRYHMFKRLNTGGSLLSEQEMRNCTVRLLSEDFIHFIQDLSLDENFKECTSCISDEQRNRKFNEELVLRFFAFKNNRDEFKHDIGDFLTDYMEAVSTKTTHFDYRLERELFLKTFRLLKEALGELSFGRTTRAGKIGNNFSVYHFEAITLGLQGTISSISIGKKEDVKRIRNALTRLKKEAEFIELTTGGGKNSPGPLRARITHAERLLNE